MSLAAYLPPVKYTVFDCGYAARLVKALKMKIVSGHRPEDVQTGKAKSLLKYNPKFILNGSDTYSVAPEERGADIQVLSKICSGIVFESDADPCEIYRALVDANFCEIYSMDTITYYTRSTPAKAEKQATSGSDSDDGPEDEPTDEDAPEIELFCCLVRVGCESG